MSLELVYKDVKRRKIVGSDNFETTPLLVPRSYYLLKVTARANGEKQLGATDDEDLIVKISDKTFPTLNDTKRLIDSPAAFSGGSLHGLSKTVYFVTSLGGGENSITLITDKPSTSATLEELVLQTVDYDRAQVLPISLTAEDGDRRPWITVVIDNLPLKSISYKVQFTRRKRDSDDIQIHVDGKIQENNFRNFKHWLWQFAGSLLPFISAVREDVESLEVNLATGLHYIEFWADRMPTLKEATLDFGQNLASLGRVPTVEDPKWTGDFYDDPQQILLARTIFAEARSQPELCQISVGWVIRNRPEYAFPRWGGTYHSIILRPGEFEPFIDQTKDNFKAMVNPLASDAVSWKKAYDIAGKVMRGEIPDPSKGANSFYSGNEVPFWADPKLLTFKSGITFFYKL